MELNTTQIDNATLRATARHIYESSDASFAGVAAEVGVADRTVKRWSQADGGWRKLSSQEISERAHAVANKIASAVGDLGAHAVDEERQAITSDLRVEAAVDERASLLIKHRSEWNIVRGLVAEAVRGRDQAKALLAVNVGRALTLAQTGERKAWGLDAGEGPQGQVTIIIERE